VQSVIIAVSVLTFTVMAEPVEPIILPPAENPEQEGQWLKATLHHWLNTEFPPEAVNADIANEPPKCLCGSAWRGKTTSVRWC